MTESKQRILREQLTLPLFSGEHPFALSAAELSLAPEDWAWLFLRLNSDYQKAYDLVAASPPDGSITQFLKNPEKVDFIRSDSHGGHASAFGISRWLAPGETRLPELNFPGTWFFPVTWPAVGLPLFVKQAHFAEIQCLADAGRDRIYPRLFAHETPYGYRCCSPVKHVTPFFHYRSTNRNWLVAAVDRSVPPIGQIAQLGRLAKIIRDALRRDGKKTHKNYVQVRLEEFRICDGSSSTLREASAVSTTNDNQSISARWGLVGIDTLGPLGRQITELERHLRKAHQAYIAAHAIPDRPPYGYVSSALPSRQINGRPHSAGNYLKALVVLHELDQLIGSYAGYPDVKAIMNVLIDPSLDRSHKVWQRDFEENIEDKYLPQAQLLVREGYRWLLHTQKP